MSVSMKSGLDGRNNAPAGGAVVSAVGVVSMKSGLDGRNNERPPRRHRGGAEVSMKSGLDGRNN